MAAPLLAAAVVLAMLTAGCPLLPGGTAPREPTDPNVHVYTSNQSFDDPTADLLVTIDGETVFDGKAKVENQHNWMLREAKLDPGSHMVVALERETGARDTHSFSFPPGEERWIVVNYWNPMDQGSSEGGDGPGFTFLVSDEQVAFA